MNHKILACCTVVLCAVLPTSLFADNLMQVYRQSLASDPTFKRAQADWLTNKENLSIAETGTGVAGTGLFPNLTGTAQLGKTYQRLTSGPGVASGSFDNNNYLLTLTQPIFNYQTWKQISSARYGAKAATATFLAAAQNLMSRVSTAYFEILRANEKLRYTLSTKRAFLQELVTAQQKFKVGLIAITGVYDAQADYDTAVADEIKDRNTVENKLENLRAITGRLYKSLRALRTVIPLVIPRPANMSRWVAIADQQNFSIKSAAYSMMSARETIKAAEAGRYPQLSGTASWGTSTSGTPVALGGGAAGAGAAGGMAGSTTGAQTGLPNITTTSGTVALNLNFPVFQGGYVFANTKQSRYKYLSKSDQLDFTHRNVDKEARQAYLGVESGISAIKADLQAIKSAGEKLKATQAGYVVGTRTMVDVLNAVKALYLSQETWADDRYDYVESIVSLKEQAGTLSPKDLAQINRWLTKPLSFRYLRTPVKVSRYGTENYPSPTEFASPPPGGKPTRIYHEPLSVKSKSPSAAKKPQAVKKVILPTAKVTKLPTLLAPRASLKALPAPKSTAKVKHNKPSTPVVAHHKPAVLHRDAASDGLPEPNITALG